MKKSSTADRIRKIMHTLGMNQQQLASYLGVSQPAVSLYLRGRVPPADILYHLARLGKTNIEWILTGESEPLLNQVQENKTSYGNENQLLMLWARLSPANQKILLSLMRELAEKQRNR